MYGTLFFMFSYTEGVGYMAWKLIRISLESWMGCPDGSGTKQNCTSRCLKLHVSVSNFFGTKRTHSRVPGLKVEALFLVCLWIVD
jgi:hypothetical protein